MSDKSLLINLDGQFVELNQDSLNPITVSYQMEDTVDFQSKGSTLALDVTVPATTFNDGKLFNAFSDPNSEDTTGTDYFLTPRPAAVVAGGDEIMNGKAILKQATHTNRPIDYTVNIYAANGDWMVQMQDMTLWDCLHQGVHQFTQLQVETSWTYDGTVEANDFVYAPVRYRKPMDNNDQEYTMYHMRPSLFIYWMIYRAFKSIGYTIKSTFMDTPYFRRLVMPWVWGNFLKIDSKALDVLKFKARARTSYGNQQSGSNNGGIGEFANSNNNYNVDNETTLGAFDNGNTYSWDGVQSKWVYPNNYYNQFGALIVGFHYKMRVTVTASWGGRASIDVFFYKNGVQLATVNVHSESAGATSTASFGGDVDIYWESPALVGGDEIEAQVWVSGKKTVLGQFNVAIYGDQTSQETYWENTYFKKPLSGIVDLRQYDKFKQYKFLDMMRGIVDTFDLQVGTDSATKTVFFEPFNPYVLADNTGTTYDGYIKNDAIDWSAKQDLSKKSVLTLFDDSDREQLFKFKDDSSDGGLNTFSNRFSITPAGSKYVLGSRFKEGQDTVENRFFSSVVHFTVSQWRNITGVAPQMIAIVPENISNTSSSEAEAEFQPKIAYFKGNTFNVGGWLWRPDPAGALYTNVTFPYMFAVSYFPGGENDPILSYTDEKFPTAIGATTYNIGRGLMKRFFLQRLATRDAGRLYQTNVFLNNGDVMNFLHRERIFLRGGQYVLVTIDKYAPLVDDSTSVTLWKIAPVIQKNIDNCFPSRDTITNQPATLTNPYDTQYQQLLLLNTDIPK